MLKQLCMYMVIYQIFKQKENLQFHKILFQETPSQIKNIGVHRSQRTK